MNPPVSNLLRLELKESSHRFSEAIDIKQSFPLASSISSIRRSWYEVEAGGLPLPRWAYVVAPQIALILLLVKMFTQ